MKLKWSRAAERDLRRLPHWLYAAKVSRAVMSFAATGEGNVRRDESGRRFRLLVGGFAAFMTFDPSRRTLLVWRVTRRRPSSFRPTA